MTSKEAERIRDYVRGIILAAVRASNEEEDPADVARLLTFAVARVDGYLSGVVQGAREREEVLGE